MLRLRRPLGSGLLGLQQQLLPLRHVRCAATASDAAAPPAAPPAATATKTETQQQQPTKRKTRIAGNTSWVKPVKLDPMVPLAAVQMLKNPARKRNFVETIALAMNLRLDTRKQDQTLRVNADLPAGTGKEARVLAFTTDPTQAQAARDAGAELVGGVELIEQLARSGTLDFKTAVATPEIMQPLARLGKVLGPRGLMPNKKLGTVVDDLAKAVLRAKAGSAELRADRGGVVHVGLGKVTMSDESILENLKAIVLTIENNKPSGAPRNWVRSAFLSNSMGRSIPLNLQYVDPKSPKFMLGE